MSTIMYNTGDPEREPLATGGEPAEYIAGVQLWVGILAALEQRAKSGGGEHVDVGLSDAAACTDEYNAAMYGFQGAIRRRYYSRHIFGYPNDIMPCADGHVVVIPGATGFRSPLATDTVSPMALLLEDPSLDDNPVFTNAGERMLRWREFEALVEPFMSTHTAMEIVLTAQAFRLPFAFVPDAEHLLSDEHLAERGFFQRIPSPAGELTVPGQPFKMSETPLESGAAPAKGRANGDVLAEIGYSKDDMNILSDQGVI
jgi:formyl-CoA transferase